MNASRTPSNFFIAGLLLWLARLSALAMAGLILLFAVGEGFHPTKLKATELILFVPFFVAWLGLWLGWCWEGLGESDARGGSPQGLTGLSEDR